MKSHVFGVLALCLFECVAQGGEFDWAKVGKKAPEGLLEVADSKRSALFYANRPIDQKTDGSAVPFLGFFISADGLAICALETLCWKEVPTFKTGEGKKLGVPKLLGIFEEEEWGLVKFSHRPEVFLGFAEAPVPLGTWVAYVAPSFVDQLVAGPVMAHRRANFQSKLKVQRKPPKLLSIAATRLANEGAGIVQGAPVIDGEGRVVAVHSFKLKLPMQTLALAVPAAGMAERIEEALKKDFDIKVPIPIEDQPFDPVIYSESYLKGNEAQGLNDYVAARKFADQTVEEFPDSEVARNWRLNLVGVSMFEPEEFAKLVAEVKLPEDSPAWKRGIYHFQLGGALQTAGNVKGAMASYLKSDELYPDGMACGTLPRYYQALNQPKEAEKFARRATEYEPERIIYWEELQKILYRLGKFDEADEIQDRVYLLEDLY
ncbi:MAG: tetratricopeptide repeat protein [Akkermansiaceae bacterium]